MVEKIQSIATSGLNGASMMMTREEGLEIVKKKEERRRKSKRKEKEWQHVVGNSAVDWRKECCWSNQFLPCLCSNAARVILREAASEYSTLQTLWFILSTIE